MTPLLSAALLRTQSDARLAALARDGHERAFEAIVERYRRPLLARCRRVLPHARAEDAVQQTFLSAWAALREGLEVRDLRPWLYRIALNAALNARKRAGYDYDELRESLGGAGGPEEDLERRRIMRETLTGLAALPDRQREALLRIAVEGESQADVARDLGVSDGAVRQLVHRARSSLRAAASAIVPFPLIARLAAAAADRTPAADRIGELVAGAGSLGVAGGVVKASTAVVVAGAVATGAGTGVHHHRARHDRPAVAVERAAAAGPAAASATTALVRRTEGRGQRAEGRKRLRDSARPSPHQRGLHSGGGPGDGRSGPSRDGLEGDRHLGDRSGPSGTDDHPRDSSGPGDGGIRRERDGGDEQGSSPPPEPTPTSGSGPRPSGDGSGDAVAPDGHEGSGLSGHGVRDDGRLDDPPSGG